MPVSREAQRGFTLVELLISVTAIMVLVAFAYVRMDKNQDVARQAAQQTADTIKAQDEQLCAISADYCTDEQKRKRRRH
jgi:prepilin-type N-terminal cleavage/methylation domain-containing protein